VKVIYQHPGGIPLNGKEYLLSKKNKVLVFNNENTALAYLKSRGIEAANEKELGENFNIYMENTND
tara:strand:+ start:60 stop:257 length:198 start_codon:yes stop_codon:yes gene_type:complete